MNEDKDREVHDGGFAGFESLLSDVEAPAGEEPSWDSRHDRAHPTEPTSATRASTHTVNSQWGGKRLGVAFVLVAVITVLWVAVASAPESSARPARPVAASYATPSIQTAKPPVGVNRVLSPSEIRYCVAEEIRFAGADAAVSAYDAGAVDLFNILVDDYNDRCGEFRYREGSLEAARVQVEPHRARLRSEGRALFAAMPTTGGGTSSGGLMPDPVETYLERYNPPTDPVADYLKAYGPEHDPPKEIARGTSTVTASADRENYRTCISGEYPTLCKHKLLTSSEALAVAAAERKANYRTCISGEYPALCKHSLLTGEEGRKVAAAERAANYRTCISGEYPALCKRQLLTSEQAALVDSAEKRANYRTCISGEYPALCKHNLLTAAQATEVANAEKRANYRTCISGEYPTLCKHKMLTAAQATEVANAEKRVNYRTCITGLYPTLCKHGLLTKEEAERVTKAERSVRRH